MSEVSFINESISPDKLIYVRNNNNNNINNNNNNNDAEEAIPGLYKKITLTYLIGL